MLEKIKEIIMEQLSLNYADITETSSFREDLGADSLDIFELVLAFEEEYEVEISSEDLEQIRTVGDVVEFIKKSENINII